MILLFSKKTAAFSIWFVAKYFCYHIKFLDYLINSWIIVPNNYCSKIHYSLSLNLYCF